MRLFILRVSAFLLTAACIVVLLFLATRQFVASKEYYRLPREKNILVLGHSHAANAFNDSLIDQLVNLASPTEGYFYTLAKVRKLLEANPKINTVFIEYTNNQLSEYANSRIFGKYADHLVRKYHAHLTWREMFYLFARTPQVMLANIPTAIKNDVAFLTKDRSSYTRFNDWGGYIPLDHRISAAKIDSAIAAGSRPAAMISRNYNLSEKNLWSLAALIKYLKEKKMNIFFFRSPTLLVRSATPSDCILHEIRKNEFHDIPFFDLQDFPLVREDFADFQHLNISGSRKLSVFMNQLLSKGLLLSTNPEEVFENELRSLTSPENSPVVQVQ